MVSLAAEDALLNEAGLSREDFVALHSVTKSEFSGRIIVEVFGHLNDQPVASKRPANLVATYHEPGLSRYIFNPVA